MDYLFIKRRVLSDNFEQLIDVPDRIRLQDIVELIIYAEEKYGILDRDITSIIFKTLEHLKGNDSQAYNFIDQLTRYSPELNMFLEKDRMD